MPVTPFHLGPVLPIKAMWPRWFSLGVFTAVQVVIDVEPVLRMSTGTYPLHGPFHTVLGSLLVALAVIPPAKYALTALYGAVRAHQARAGSLPPWLLTDLTPVSWPSAVIGGFVGAVSHVLLDALIHWDVTPFAPWSRMNPLLIPRSFVWVHVLCGVIGLSGLLWWLCRLRSHYQVAGHRTDQLAAQGRRYGG
jgi:hypothetical protein